MTIRRFDWEDLAALAHLLAKGIDKLAYELHSPIAHCLVAEVDKVVVGCSLFTRKSQEKRGWGRGYVHPDFRQQGIGRQLVQASEDWLRQEVGEAAIMQRHIPDLDEPVVRLLKAEGYLPVRHSYEMRLELGDVQAPGLPEGLFWQPFDPQRDAFALYTADREAFQDNWGYDLITFDEWLYEHLKRPDFDPSLWQMLMDGKDIAGFCMNYPSGWVDTMGVPSAWRGRGFGELLMKRTFFVFKQHGIPAAALGVDAGNPRAVGLYQRLGMRVTARGTVYQKLLNGNE